MKKPFFQNLLFELSQAFFPEGIKCLSCGDELPREMKYCLCGKCLPKFTFLGADICQKCGVKMENAAPFCQTCKMGDRPFDKARGVLFYTGEAARLIKDYKAGDKYLAPYFAGMMSDYYLENLSGYSIDAACSVPSGKRRVKERGYNQAAELAKLFCEKTGIPFYDCLAETRLTRKQALLKSAERRENVKGAYGIKADFPSESIKNKNVMLIDDIFTTGSTAGECASVLKKAGAGEVCVFTLATGKGL